MTRIAVVTGGTRGIGAAISLALRDAGHRVAAVYAGNVEAAEAFRSASGIDVFRWSVADPEACERGLAEVEAALGPVDVLVNNAGITRDGVFHRMEFDAWRAVMATNLDGLFAMTRPLIAGMRSRGFGRIVNISSVNGQKGQFGQVNYAAAKAGVVGFTKALALESAGRGVTVNCVAPGYIDTDMVAAVPEAALKTIVAGIPVGRLGRGEEIASLVAWLASDAAGFMTGAVLSMNGGQYMANG